MTDTIEDKIAGIIMECNDQHGLRAYEAAERILALPEICFVMDQKFVTIDEVRRTANLPGKGPPNLGHSIKVR